MKNLINLDKDFDFSNITWDFKILFLVPLKALANEIVNKFNYQLKFLNIITNEFSGDVNLSREQIEKTNRDYRNKFIGIGLIF
jgi:replicative superfamily II helicase